MSNEALIVILLVVLVVGALPAWPYSKSWGYGPTGLLAAVLIALVLWAMMGGRDLKSPGQELKSDVRETGEDLRDLGREAAEGLRKAVQ